MPRQLIRNFGTSLYFDGSTAKVVTPLWQAAQSNFSMSAFFKTENYKTNRQCIITNGSGFTAQHGVGVIVSGNATTDGSLMLLNHSVGWTDTGFKIQDNNWHHVVLVLDASGHPTVYVDGVNVYTSGSVTFNTAVVAGLVGSDNSGTGFFKGFIDEVQVWGRALTSAEAIALYYGTQPDITSAISYYKFNEGSGTSATDSVGSNTGVITAATYSSNVFMVPRTVVS